MKMSSTVGVKNVPTENQTSCSDTNMCLELALEGERLCEAGKPGAGVAFFQAALQAGTDDLQILSDIYSQLGNAYFNLGDYAMAMKFHKRDLALARFMEDRLGEAESSGNLGITLKAMGQFDEAMICCKRHLEISREIGDKPSEGRALYNLGNVYLARGQKSSRAGHQGTEEVKECLQQAANNYQENLELMKELGDSAAQGRACGNLGNTYYLLGDFQKAISCYKERLKIARQFGDKTAERRTSNKLGNSHVSLGEFEKAAQHYRRTLMLAQELGDQAFEAQACYSLGNTYVQLQNYSAAIEYYLRHLLIAQQLKDRVGEGRGCWFLTEAYSAVSNYEQSLYYAKLHLQISSELGDSMGEATAQMNVSNLQKMLGIEKIDDEKENVLNTVSDDTSGSSGSSSRTYRLRRESMENLDLMKLTPDGKAKVPEQPLRLRAGKTPQMSQKAKNSRRINDQMKKKSSLNQNKAGNKDKDEEDLMQLIAGMQSKRMDEQRVALPYLPGLNTTKRKTPVESSNQSLVEEDSFFEKLVRCQSYRLEDQRSTLPNCPRLKDDDQENNENAASGATIPEEDLFALIQRLQAGRMEDQRAKGPDELQRHR
ncbi:G-protein-signaling modulator 2-like [Nasonia vitripennis]|uniref:G-protein-signaling modulator 2 n=1 Tax=Nasonia vitripennis TaxID=7425 RepID=A0A7M7QXJ4_NASVI|nr:G-protein-signaling modulator 2-like [Nasonia vitripennis]